MEDRNCSAAELKNYFKVRKKVLVVLVLSEPEDKCEGILETTSIVNYLCK